MQRKILLGMVLLLIGSGMGHGLEAMPRLFSPGAQPISQETMVYYAGEQATLPEVQVGLQVQNADGSGAAENDEIVYTGPVSFSVVYGAAFDGNNEINGLGMVNDTLSVRRGEAYEALPWNNFHKVKIYVDLSWPGIESMLQRLQTFQQQGKSAKFQIQGMALDIYLERGNAYSGTVSFLSFRSPLGGWITHDLPNNIQKIWVQPVVKHEDRPDEPGPPITGSWELALFDTTPRRGKIQEDVCQTNNCLPSDFLTQFDQHAGSNNAIPVFCPGQTANGTTVQRAWFENRTVWENPTRETGFTEQTAASQPGEKLLLIQISGNSTRNRFFLAYPETSGKYIQITTNGWVLFGESAAAIAWDFPARNLFRIENALVLSALVPSEFSIEQALLINDPYGPIWRLKC